jgi:hypothetical protein
VAFEGKLRFWEIVFILVIPESPEFMSLSTILKERCVTPKEGNSLQFLPCVLFCGEAPFVLRTQGWREKKPWLRCEWEAFWL